MPSTGTTAARSAPAADTRVVTVAGAGTVTVGVSPGRLAVVRTDPHPGWAVEVEVATGREVEVDFRRGAERVQVNVELEDGQVRERVRVRNDATGADVRTGDDHGGGDGGDRHRSDDGPGDDGADHGGDRDRWDSSGRGGSDDRSGDDDGGGDDGADHGGDRDRWDSSGRGGSDDRSGDDDGGDRHRSGGHGSDD